MNTTALVIAISYAVVTVIGIAVFLLLSRSTTASREVDTERIAHREKAWLAVVAGGLVALLFATIFFTPYGAPRRFSILPEAYEALAVAAVTNGRNQMPSFANSLGEEDIAAVAAYVSESAAAAASP